MLKITLVHALLLGMYSVYHTTMVIAVGNAVLLKPSELAVHTSNVLMELIPQYMDPVSSYGYVFVSVCLSVCLCAVCMSVSAYV